MAPRKKLSAIIKLQIQVDQTNPTPPVDPTLGAHSVNIMKFCKAYNATTENQHDNVVPVEISVYKDRSFTFVLKTPPTAKLLPRAADIKKGSGIPHTDKAGSMTWGQCKGIAELKKPGLNTNDIEMGARIVVGTARFMGITVEGTK